MPKPKTVAAAAAAVLGVGVARASDWTLIALSLATAGGAVGFAAYATLSGDGGAHVNGMQYLAIFAQPSHPAHAGVDMAPVGAIPRDVKDNAGGFRLVGAEPRFAWLRDGDHIFAVRPGDDVPRLGRIGAIEQREGRWALIDGKGGVLLVSPRPDLAPSAGGHFQKRMIFGE